MWIFQIKENITQILSWFMYLLENHLGCSLQTGPWRWSKPSRCQTEAPFRGCLVSSLWQSGFHVFSCRRSVKNEIITMISDATCGMCFSHMGGYVMIHKTHWEKFTLQTLGRTAPATTRRGGRSRSVSSSKLVSPDLELWIRVIWDYKPNWQKHNNILVALARTSC